MLSNEIDANSITDKQRGALVPSTNVLAVLATVEDGLALAKQVWILLAVNAF